MKILGKEIFEYNIYLTEDKILTVSLFQVAKSFKFIDIFGIIYIENPDSICHNWTISDIFCKKAFNFTSLFLLFQKWGLTLKFWYEIKKLNIFNYIFQIKKKSRRSKIGYGRFKNSF